MWPCRSHCMRGWLHRCECNLAVSCNVFDEHVSVCNSKFRVAMQRSRLPSDQRYMLCSLCLWSKHNCGFIWASNLNACLKTLGCQAASADKSVLIGTRKTLSCSKFAFRILQQGCSRFPLQLADLKMNLKPSGWTIRRVPMLFLLAFVWFLFANVPKALFVFLQTRCKFTRRLWFG